MSVQTKQIDYTANGDHFSGYFAWDDALQGTLPGVILVHEWWGHDDYIRGRAEQMAGEGFAAFALDMYGKGKTAADPDEAGTLMNTVLEMEGAIEQRFSAALQTLLAQPQVNSENILAAGYCFGGAVVLAMARAGKDLRAVASFHGLLETGQPMQAGVFNGSIAAFTGADDPMVSPEIVDSFEQEMNEAGVTCSLTSYPGVVHGFTNPAATARGEKYGLPLAYNAAADQDSFQAMLELFRERTTG